MYIENFRKKLRKKYRNLIGSDENTFESNLSSFLDFLRNNTITNSILEELTLRDSYNENWMPKSRGMGFDLNLPNNELDLAALSLSLLDQCTQKRGLAMNIGFKISNKRKAAEAIRYFNTIFAKEIYEYVDEKIEDGNLILYYLNRFKARSEWFFKKQLYDLYIEDTKRGEKHLTIELQKYLFEEGIDYPYSEPNSPSGKPDLIEGMDSDNPLTLEVKLFQPEKNYDRSYIRKGFRQAFDYTEDYNQPFGYLLIFNLSDYNIKFTTKDKYKPTKIDFGDKTIFIVVINLYYDGKSSSQKGKLRPYEITEEYLKSEG